MNIPKWVAYLVGFLWCVILGWAFNNDVTASEAPMYTKRIDPRSIGMMSVCFEGYYYVMNQNQEMVQVVGYKGTGLTCK